MFLQTKRRCTILLLRLISPSQHNHQIFGEFTALAVGDAFLLKPSGGFPPLGPLYVLDNFIHQLVYGFRADIQERVPLLFTGFRSFFEPVDRTSNGLQSLAITLTLPSKFVDKIPIRQLSERRFFRRDF